MSRILGIVCVCAAGAVCGPAAPAEQLARSRPALTVSKETTHITEPLVDGWPDYIGALNRRLGQGVTRENNAVVLFYAAFGPAPDGTEQPDRFFELLGIPKPQPGGEYFVGYGRYVQDAAGLLPGTDEFAQALEQQWQAMRRPWRAEQFGHVADWLKRNERPLALMVEGTRRPKYFSPLVGGSGESPGGLMSVLLPGVQQTRDVARALCARAMLRAGRGETDAAWQDLLACHRLGRLTGQGPTLIEALVGIAIDAIALAGDVALIEHTQLDAAMVRQIQADLERLPPLPRMLDMLEVGERHMYLDSVLMIARGDKETMELLEGDRVFGRTAMRLGLKAIDWDVVLRLGNESYDKLAAALRKPDRAQRNIALNKATEEIEGLMGQVGPEALQKLAAESKNPRDALSQLSGRVMLGLLFPAVTQSIVAEDRAVQRVRNVQAALALAAFHQDHGRYPEKLDELSPRYVKDVPADHFTGQPLVYRPQGRGYVLYSVGPNETDDGGRDQTAEPAGDDLVLRMPQAR